MSVVSNLLVIPYIEILVSMYVIQEIRIVKGKYSIGPTMDNILNESGTSSFQRSNPKVHSYYSKKSPT
jgi:hypothetical protein